MQSDRCIDVRSQRARSSLSHSLLPAMMNEHHGRVRLRADAPRKQQGLVHVSSAVLIAVGSEAERQRVEENNPWRNSVPLEFREEGIDIVLIEQLKPVRHQMDV